MAGTAFYTPDTHMLESERNSRLGWCAAAAELIDNSLDAGALQILLEISAKGFIVSDDGNGTPDLVGCLTFGSHRKHNTTTLGCYGVGLKNAWLYAGKTIDITSTHCDVTRHLRVTIPGDFRFEDGRWVGPAPDERPATANDKGTRICIEQLTRRLPSMENLKRELQLIFSPAIESGKQIIVREKGRRRPLEQFRLPAMSESVRDDFFVEGREVHLEVGIVADGEKIDESGFLLCYGHRVLKYTTMGTGDYSASRLTGRIVLGRGWKLTKNKDDLSDLKEELDEAIFFRIRELCERAGRLSETIESAELRHELEESLNEMIDGTKAKEKRNQSHDHVGTIQPKHTGVKRRRAAKIDPVVPGSVDIVDKGGRKKKGHKIDWWHCDPDVIGKYDAESKKILLNLDNDFVAMVKGARNRPALLAVAMGLLAEGGSQQIFAFDRKSFAQAWGKCLAGQHFAKEKVNGTEAA